LTTGPGDASGNAIGISAGSSLDLDVNTINVSSSGSVYLSEVNSANIGAGGISVGGTPRLLTLVSGTFVLGGANRISDNVRVALDSATLKLNGFDETVATVEGSSGLGRVVNDSSTLATLTLQDNVSSYTSNLIFGGTTANENNLGLVKSGTAIALISGNNTFTGPVSINAGRWDMGHANSLGAASGTTTVNSGAQLQLNGNSTAEPLSLNGNGGVGTLGAVANNGALSVLSGPITLAGDTLIAGNGSIQFTGVITDGAGTFGLSKFGNRDPHPLQQQHLRWTDGQ
jgi:fibronectin-binding autotransporter adhesin